MDRSHSRSTERLSGCGACNPKIRHLHFSIPCNNNILRLDIPVNDALFMGSCNSLCHLDSNPDGFLAVETALFQDVVFQGDALNQLHDDIVKRSLIHNVIYVYNIRMGQPGRSLGFHLELAHKSAV